MCSEQRVVFIIRWMLKHVGFSGQACQGLRLIGGKLQHSGPWKHERMQELLQGCRHDHRLDQWYAHHRALVLDQVLLSKESHPTWQILRQPVMLHHCMMRTNITCDIFWAMTIFIQHLYQFLYQETIALTFFSSNCCLSRWVSDVRTCL